MDRYRVLTWHVHGAYLESLALTGLELYLPRTDDGRAGYGGRAGLALPDTVHEVALEDVPRLGLDAILFQSVDHWQEDRWSLLSAVQRRLPTIFLEHDPPRESPTDTHHPVDDADVLLVHVTAFNALMWDSGHSPVRVVEHGVAVPDGIAYRGEQPRGMSAINNLAARGRRLGADVFAGWRSHVPLDLYGMGAEAFGGREVAHRQLPEVLAAHRFFAYPVRYTSLSMALVEAMLIGLPVVALATTEIPSVVDHGRTGFLSSDPDALLEPMRTLLADPALAARMGAEARRDARERFGIERFAADWQRVVREVVGRPAGAVRVPGADLDSPTPVGVAR